MRIIIRPVMDPQREVDLTERLVAAIAQELWRLYGGNDKLNWLEAEVHLARLVGEARAEAAQTKVLYAVPGAAKSARPAKERSRRPGGAERPRGAERPGGAEPELVSQRGQVQFRKRSHRSVSSAA